MKYLVPALAILIACSAFAETGTVESIHCKTAVRPPAYRVPASLRKNEELFRAGLKSLPEGLLVIGALTVGGGDLGLSDEQSAKLAPLVSDTYAKIHADPTFAETSSALPYCFSSTKPKSGHYFMYRPKEVPDDPTCIVFLHGYGGNFQFYTWAVKEAFPDAVILAPSWGISWQRGSVDYIKAMLADAAERLDMDLPEPWLMGISAGGRGGFPIYRRMSKLFQGYVCIASAPTPADIRSLRKDDRILMINGTDDAMVPIRIARRQAELAKRRVPSLSYQETEGDHFFLLAHRNTTFSAIQAFMQDDEQTTEATGESDETPGADGSE